MELERWRPIPDFPGYAVSSYGRVYSEKRRPPRIMRVAADGERRPIIALRRDGQLVSRRVHVLMLAAFVGPRPDGAVIRHRDGDPTNNYLGNLAYGTHSENGLDAVRHGTHVQASKTECVHGHPYTPENTYICPRGRRECRACRKAASARSHAARVARQPKPPTERWGECETLHGSSPTRVAVKQSGRRHCLECHRIRAKAARDRAEVASIGMG